jgi:hypothetical protein
VQVNINTLDTYIIRYIRLCYGVTFRKLGPSRQGAQERFRYFCCPGLLLHLERKKQPGVQQLDGESSSTSHLGYGRMQGLGSCRVLAVVGLHSVVISVLVWWPFDG